MRRSSRANRTPPTWIVEGLHRQGNDAADVARPCRLLAKMRSVDAIDPKRTFAAPQRAQRYQTMKSATVTTGWGIAGPVGIHYANDLLLTRRRAIAPQTAPSSNLAKWILPDESGGMHDRKARFTFPRLSVTEPGEVDIALRITRVATGVDGWLQLPDQSDRARGDLIGIQI